METVEENPPAMVVENSPAAMGEENSLSMVVENPPAAMGEENSTDMSVLIQFAKFSKGYRISDFDDFVKGIGLEKIDFFGRLAYPNQWQMRLTDRGIRESLIEAGKYRIKNRCCWIYPLNQREIRGFVHWLPNSVTNDQLKDQLQLYGEVLMVESQERIVAGQRVESDPRYYGLILTPGTVKEDLPHFLKINQRVCLVVVRGRQPACFHCREVGHRRAQCQKYKEKLTSFCQRPPNTASQRLITRGRRHVKTVTEVEDISRGNEVSSSDGIVHLERQSPVAEATSLLLPVSEDPKGVTEEHEEAIGSTGPEFVDSDRLADKKSKYYFDNSAVPISAERDQKQDIIKIIQQVQRKVIKDLQERLNAFGEELRMIVSQKELSSEIRYQRENTVCPNLKELGKQSLIYDDQETATPVEIPGEDSTANVKGTEDHEMESVLETMHEVKGDAAETIEIIDKKPEEMGKEIQTEMPGEDSTVNVKGIEDHEMQSVLETMHKVKGHTAETIEIIDKKPEETGKEIQTTESTSEASAFQMKVISRADLMLNDTEKVVFGMVSDYFKRMKQFVESRTATDKTSRDSSADTDPKLSQDDLQSLPGIVGRAKQLNTDCPGNTPKLEEINTNLSSQLSAEGMVTDTKLTEEATCFAKQMLEKTEKRLAETIINTFKNLKESIKSTHPCPTTTAYETTISEKLEDIEIDPPVSKTDIKVDIGIGFDKSSEEIETQSESANIIDSKEIEFFDPSKEKLTTKAAFSDGKGTEWDVSKAIQEDRDKLQTAIKKIFASVQDESELLPATREILKKVELKVIDVFDATKHRLRTDSK